MAEVLVSNMAMWPLMALPLETTGLLAKSMGYDGIEYVPTKAGNMQIEKGGVGKAARIKAGHQGWRSESYGKKGLKELWDTRSSGLGHLVAGIITIAGMPAGIGSLEPLAKLQNIIGTSLPVVLYLEMVQNPKILPFTDMTVQITPEWLKKFGIESVEQLKERLAGWRVNPCYDNVHSGDLDDKFKDYVLEEAIEVHVGVNRVDMQGSQGSLNELIYAKKARRIVVEAALATPGMLYQTEKAIRYRLT